MVVAEAAGGRNVLFLVACRGVAGPEEMVAVRQRGVVEASEEAWWWNAPRPPGRSGPRKS